MPGLFVTAIILALVGGICLVLRRRARSAHTGAVRAREAADAQAIADFEEAETKYKAAEAEGKYHSVAEPRRPKPSDPTSTERELVVSASVTRWVAVGLFVLAGFFTFLASFNPVTTKHVGVVLEFGKAVDERSEGANFTWPWQKMIEMDASIQTDELVGNADNDTQSCVSVRIARQGTACVDIITQWRLKDSAAQSAYRDYRDFENVRRSLVFGGLQSTGNSLFDTYDALAADDKGNSLTPTNEELSVDATTMLREKVGDRIEIISVSVNFVHLDKKTQARLDAFNEETAKTRTAVQAQATATAQAEANRILAASVSNDPNVLTAICFEIWSDLAKDGVQPPAAGLAGCWPGGQPVLVVPQASGQRPN
jgi:regulator of protease activity HflC (stomatin/prohibitin superfamily)